MTLFNTIYAPDYSDDNRLYRKVRGKAAEYRPKRGHYPAYSVHPRYTHDKCGGLLIIECKSRVGGYWEYVESPEHLPAGMAKHLYQLEKRVLRILHRHWHGEESRGKSGERQALVV